MAEEDEEEEEDDTTEETVEVMSIENNSFEGVEEEILDHEVSTINGTNNSSNGFNKPSIMT